ncbi:YD repeat-containing protein [Rutstroemia sp. NJR-2017a BBW]|nr:YD repeat-containing protein [Rutstroemia sp. NJR-2017a BBW]
MSSGSAIYSQGFNFSRFMQKGVDPRSGQYTCGIDLYEIPEQTRNCPPFKLTLTFNPLNNQNVGLGQGWTFNLPYYNHRQSPRTVVFTTGESFGVTETSTNLFVNDQKLKSSLFKKIDASSYQAIYKSGQIEVLSNFKDSYDKAVLVELYSETGRSLSFSWSRSGETPRLEKIQHGSETLLEIKYGTSQIEITKAPNTPESSTFTLIQREDQLSEVHLPTEGAPFWKFTYNSMYQIHVTSPSGLIKEINYREQGHLFPKGAPLPAIPYVISHVSRPGNEQPPIRTQYSYSDQNFLAYGSTHNWRGGEDNLYLARDEYEYTSTVEIVGGTWTKHTYNKFHLLVSSEQQQGTKQIIQTTTYHAIPFAKFENQPPYYQLPMTGETIYKDTVSEATRKETSQHTFDDFGNPIQDIQANGIKTDRMYYPAAGESGSDGDCPPDPHGFQRYIKKETVTPACNDLAGPVRSEEYTYSQISTATGAKAAYFVAVQHRQSFQADELPTKIDHNYINQPSSKGHGRLQRQVMRLFDQHPTTQDWLYTTEANQMKQPVTTQTFDGSVVSEETVYSLWTGLKLTHKNEIGISSSYSHDTLGRLVKTITALGTSSESIQLQEYSILGGNGGTSRTTTDAKGLKTRYISDGLDRLCLVEKQDDTRTFRVIQEDSYNAQDQLVQTSEIDWMRTDKEDSATEQRSTKLLEYDNWGNVNKTIESTGQTTLSIYDPITMMKTEGIEGEGMTKTQLNVFGTPTQIALHLSDKNNTLYSKVNYTYDGLNRLISRKDQLNRTTEYRTDQFDRVVETSWSDNRVMETQYSSQTTAVLPTSMKVNDKSIGTQSFDGLGRVTSKVTGMRTTTQSYREVSPEPAQITNNNGVSLHLEYEPALEHVLKSVTSGSRSSVDDDKYEYDPQTAAPLQYKGSYSIHDLQYLASGQLSRENIQITDGPTLSAHYVFSMAGKLQKYTDVNGKTHEMRYDEYGRAQSLVQRKLKVTFSYDAASRVIESRVEDEEKKSKITTSLTYDDFGRETKRLVFKGETKLYHLSQTYNETGLVASRYQENTSGAVVRNEKFEYDAHNRLKNYECTGSEPPIDQNGNPICSQHFAFDDYDNIVQSSTTFQDGSQNAAACSFSAQDPTQLSKITNTNPDYPSAVELVYDRNDCLTEDEQGRILQYDGMSRLIAVRDRNNAIFAEYQYDAVGKLVCQKVPNQPDTRLFYRDSILIAVQKGDSKVSYLSDGDDYWGEAISQDSKDPDKIENKQYTPYGCSGPVSGSSSSSIGFGGQWRDPVTGWYHLGNGYRVYNPDLMRFHSPDPWSPFTSGEINPYVYCLGDPVNRADPNGHWSFFKKLFKSLGWKDLVMAVIGIAVSVAVGVLTGGASLAIQIGVGIAAGVVTDVVGGMVANAVEGKPITWGSVGIDALGGLLGGVAGELGGAAFKAGIKGIKTTLGRAGSFTLAKGVGTAARKGTKAAVMSGLRGTARSFIPSQATSRVGSTLVSPDVAESNPQQSSRDVSSTSGADSGNSNNSTNPLGRSGPSQIGCQSYYLGKSSYVPRDVMRPLMKDGDDEFSAGASSSGNKYGAGARDGQAVVANLLSCASRFDFGPLIFVQDS